MTQTLHIARRGLLAALPAAGLSACATPAARTGFAAPPLAPIRTDPERLTRITVCLRPFRAAGPRLDVEPLGTKRVVHNYGHGGSGWSLSWGSAEIAARNALAGGLRPVAVIGCGAIGLTTAVTLQRMGAAVTIYAAERTPDTRSARATGSWTPDSRIAQADTVGPDFGGLWEQMARLSYRRHHGFVGLPGDPVAFADRYNLADAAPRGGGGAAGRFAEYADRIADLLPRAVAVPPSEHPFPVRYARRGVNMQFNVAAYAHLLTMDFLAGGGRMVERRFDSPAELAALPEAVIVNCTGYGARALWRDESIVPVRGQIAWLAPQPEVHYGVYYRGVSLVPRPDGIVVQDVGANEEAGWGLTDETPDPAEATRALSVVRPLFR